MRKIADGTSKTMLVGEKYVPRNMYEGKSYGDNFAWIHGTQWEVVRFAGRAPQNDDPLTELIDNGNDGIVCDGCDHFGSPHPGGFNAALCDGSVRTVSYDIELPTFQALCNRADGTTFELP